MKKSILGICFVFLLCVIAAPLHAKSPVLTEDALNEKISKKIENLKESKEKREADAKVNHAKTAETACLADFFDKRIDAEKEAVRDLFNVTLDNFLGRYTIANCTFDHIALLSKDGSKALYMFGARYFPEGYYIKYTDNGQEKELRLDKAYGIVTNQSADGNIYHKNYEKDFILDRNAFDMICDINGKCLNIDDQVIKSKYEVANVNTVVAKRKEAILKAGFSQSTAERYSVPYAWSDKIKVYDKCKRLSCISGVKDMSGLIVATGHRRIITLKDGAEEPLIFEGGECYCLNSMRIKEEPIYTSENAEDRYLRVKKIEIVKSNPISFERI